MTNLLIGLVLGLISAKIFELLIINVSYLRQHIWDNPKLIFGYHFHHSILGLILILSGVIFLKENRSKSLFLIGFGLGIIIIHALTDGRLIFITR